MSSDGSKASPLAALSPDQIEALARQHHEFLCARLVSPEARAEWKQNVRAAWETWMAAPVGESFDRESVIAAVESLFQPQVLRRGLKPFVHSAALLLMARLREDQRAVGEYVPESARPKLDRLLAMQGLVPEVILRQVIEHEALEGVMRDVLFEALKEFSEKVNPFFAEWGLPALLKRFTPFGLGGMGKTFESVRAEFDRRLEPEIRRFLQGFARRALDSFGDFIATRIDQPAFVALRKSIVERLLEQPVTTITPAADDARVAVLEEILMDVAEHVLTLESSRRERRSGIELALTAHANQRLREALAVYGITTDFDTDAFAEATWPALRTALSSDPIRGWLKALTVEFYATLNHSERLWNNRAGG